MWIISIRRSCSSYSKTSNSTNGNSSTNVTVRCCMRGWIASRWTWARIRTTSIILRFVFVIWRTYTWTLFRSWRWCIRWGCWRTSWSVRRFTCTWVIRITTRLITRWRGTGRAKSWTRWTRTTCTERRRWRTWFSIRFGKSTKGHYRKYSSNN